MRNARISKPNTSADLDELEKATRLREEVRIPVAGMTPYGFPPRECSKQGGCTTSSLCSLVNVCCNND